MTDRETIQVYDQKATEYADLTAGIADDPRLFDFIARLPDGGSVLDLGCGPGTYASALAEAGLHVSAWDASAEMVRLARSNPRVDAAQRVFDDLDTLEPQSLDGVWANFSLLHAPRSTLPDHLDAITRALRPGGVFVIALKEGHGESRDRIGRLYTYCTEPELRRLVTDAGLTPVRTDRGRDKGLSGEDADWISLTCLR